MRKIFWALSCAILACAAGAPRAASAQVRPRIRAVTAFIEIDPNNYAARIQEAQKFLVIAKDALNKAGFEGAGGRITTQPFPQYTKGMKAEDAVAFVGKLREAASKGPRDRKSTRLNSSHSQISYAVFCLHNETAP